MNKALLIFVFGSTVLSARVAAQTLQPPDDTQSWNDIQLTVPLTEHFEFYTAATVRLGGNITRLNGGRYAIGFGWKPHRSLNILPFYWYINMRNAAGKFRHEDRLNLRATYRFPFKQFGLIHRSTYEYRIRRPVKSWRYRFGMLVEKDLPKKFMRSTKAFVGDEIFYDSILNRISRNRFTAGINKVLSKQLSVDLYYLRQNDRFSRPGNLNVVGVTWRVKM
jgi:hypothetical protein